MSFLYLLESITTHTLSETQGMEELTKRKPCTLFLNGPLYSERSQCIGCPKKKKNPMKWIMFWFPMESHFRPLLLLFLINVQWVYFILVANIPRPMLCLFEFYVFFCYLMLNFVLTLWMCRFTSFIFWFKKQHFYWKLINYL